MVTSFSQIAAARSEWLKRHNFPPRLVRAVQDPKATSDDEESPDRTQFLYKPVQGRSAKMNTLVRTLDSLREAENIAANGAPPGPRKPHPDPNAATIFKMKLLNLPLDWYDPAYFNALPMQTRRDQKIDVDAFTFPLDDTYFPLQVPRTEWNKMSDRKFHSCLPANFKSQAGYDLEGTTAFDYDEVEARLYEAGIDNERDTDVVMEDEEPGEDSADGSESDIVMSQDSRTAGSQIFEEKLYSRA